MERLWEHGASVRAYDPVAQSTTRAIYGERPDLALCESPMEAVQDADALIIVTEWNLFRSPNFRAIRAALRSPVLLDGRNMYEPEHLKEEGFTYYAVGRGDSVGLR